MKTYPMQYFSLEIFIKKKLNCQKNISNHLKFHNLNDKHQKFDDTTFLYYIEMYIINRVCRIKGTYNSPKYEIDNYSTKLLEFF